MTLLLSFVASSGAAIDASNRYRSPRNPERKIRQSTELIVLHTTEAPARSSLNKLCDRGECHFCVTEDGRIWRIVDRDREAFHAGRSMWNGKEDVDKFSIGIECVGYHDKPMPMVQLAAIRDLVKDLKAMYRITDDRVVCHSHVAYGAPNRWHRRKHRGRKRCGMLFAMPSVRRILDLKMKPAYDRDVVARRLIIGDQYLHSVLYRGIDTMKTKYGMPAKTAISAAPAKKKLPTTGKAKSLTAKSPTAKSPATKAPAIAKMSTVEQLKAAGYVIIGTIAKNHTAISIAGAKWNAADTYYVLKGKVSAGNTIDASKLEKGMSVWRKK